MKIDKSQIIDLLRERGEDFKVNQAQDELPGTVDTKKDHDLLAKLGLDEQAIIGGLGDRLGGLGDKFGL